MRTIVKKLNFTTTLLIITAALCVFAFVNIAKAGCFTCGNGSNYQCPGTPRHACIETTCVLCETGCAPYIVTQKQCTTGGSATNCRVGHAVCSASMNWYAVCSLCMCPGFSEEWASCAEGSYANRCIFD